jgi:hypothetical protein
VHTSAPADAHGTFSSPYCCIVPFLYWQVTHARECLSREEGWLAEVPRLFYFHSPSHAHLIRPCSFHSQLLKTKVHRRSDRCRVGIRIRANPQNCYPLTDIVVMMMVPPDVDGERVTMSRKGGIWDEMKRSLVWTIQQLGPGETVDIQAQFKVVGGGQHGTAAGGSRITGRPPPPGMAAVVGDHPSSSRFPILARCNGAAAFSKIDLNTEYAGEGSTPVDLRVERSATVLYRNV